MSKGFSLPVSFFLSPAVRAVPLLFLRPVYLLRTYRRTNLQPDMLAGLTVAVVLLPQAIVFPRMIGQ